MFIDDLKVIKLHAYDHIPIKKRPELLRQASKTDVIKLLWNIFRDGEVPMYEAQRNKASLVYNDDEISRRSSIYLHYICQWWFTLKILGRTPENYHKRM